MEQDFHVTDLIGFHLYFKSCTSAIPSESIPVPSTKEKQPGLLASQQLKVGIRE